MVQGDRLKAIRQSKNLSQGDIEKRTGLLRCFISRCEQGHTVPCVETLEKWTRALDIPLYQLFHDGNSSGPVRPLVVPQPKGKKLSRKDTVMLNRLGGLLGRMKDSDKSLIVTMASKMAARG
jgi:transcriptional regulator with XRE-family HTH domain